MRKIVIIIISLILIIISNSFGQLGTGSSYLKLGIGPRQVGMGSAFTGVGDDLYTIYWNPGGLGKVRWWELSAMYNNYFADMYYGSITGVKQFRILGSRKTTVGFGLFYHGMPEWDSTEGLDNTKAKANSILAITSFGQRLDWLTKNLSLGLNLKFGRSTLSEYTAYTIATDFGLMYELDLLNRPLMIGAAVQNIGFQTKYINDSSPVPLGFRTGLSYRFLNCNYHNLLLATDIAKYKYSDIKVSFGAEYWFKNLLALRGGYIINNNDIGDLSFGLSVKIDAFNSGLQSDITRTNYGNVLGYNSTGAVSIYAVNPEPFRLLSPDNNTIFCPEEDVILTWEKSPDPDFCDLVSYRVLIDPNVDILEENIATVCKKPLDENNVFLDLLANDVKLVLPEISPNVYFWTTIAIDKNGHTRWSNEIRSFIKSAPDLQIRELTYILSDTLPNFEDNYQGAVKIVLENRGLCTAYNFQMSLKDSFYCKEQNNIIGEFKIDSLNAGRSITKYVSWQTNNIGKHHFTSEVDQENVVFELNDDNNLKHCKAITIPRGYVESQLDTVLTDKLVYIYNEIPILPVVFFEANSNRISNDYYQQDMLRPVPMLEVISNRMKQNESLKIRLAGYIDVNSESVNTSLAKERMQQIKVILVDSLGVSSDQISFTNDYDITAYNIKKAPGELVSAENRRVELLLTETDNKKFWELFGPVESYESPKMTSGVKLESEVKAYVDIVNWQLQIHENETGKVIYRAPYNIDISKNNIDLKNTIIWDGKDNQQNLVELNKLYRYSILIQDIFGREFSTKMKTVFLECPNIQEQNVQIHLNKFDSSDEYFSFGSDRMLDLVAELIKSPSLKVKFNGYSCEIGEFEYNLNLAYSRAENFRNKFIQLLRNEFEKQNDQTESWEDLLARVQQNITKIELAEKYHNISKSFSEPLKYCNPCTIKEFIYPHDNPYGRMLSRRVDIILFQQKFFYDTAKED